MSKEPEIEFKNLLTAEEYNQLLSEYDVNSDELFVQTNYYFDTIDKQLERKHSALRIRIFAESAELTLKTPYKSYLMETTDYLIIEEAYSLLKKETIKTDGSVAAALKEMSISPKAVKLIGSLKTTRFEHKTKQGLIVLDKSEYFGKVDYELEYEAEDVDEGKVFFNQFMERHSIPKRLTKNKVARMKEASEVH